MKLARENQTGQHDLNFAGDIKIEFTELHPGEKLHEELFIGNNFVPSEHKRIKKSDQDFFLRNELEPKIKLLEMALVANYMPKVLSTIEKLDADYASGGDIDDRLYL